MGDFKKNKKAQETKKGDSRKKKPTGPPGAAVAENATRFFFSLLAFVAGRGARQEMTPVRHKSGSVGPFGAISQGYKNQGVTQQP